jgi:capsular exopolysaccharide synthesis family protein
MHAENESALGPYLRAIRAHKWIVLLVTLAALGGSLAWLALRTPDYEATTEILVTPVSQDDATYIGLPLLRDSGEPTRTIQTAATLIESTTAAELTAKKIGRGFTRDDIASAIKVNPEGESNILGVTAKTEDPVLAARIANEFAQAALDARRRLLDAQVRRTLRQLNQREIDLRGTPAVEASADLQRRISALQEIADGNDPTLSVVERATTPEDPIGAPPWLVLALSLIGGFALGTGTALVMRLGARRIRDEEEVLSTFSLPILARVPVLSRRILRRPGMAPGVREAFRTLIAQIEVRAPGDRVFMVTSASRNDGKTSSAINLALSLVAAGHRVVLIDFDLRKPDIARRLKMSTGEGLAGMLAPDAQLADFLLPAPQLPLLSVATTASTQGDVALLEALLRRLPAILDQASAIADYVIVDTAPVGEVSDALKVVDFVDQVLVVVRPANTNRVNLEQARELLSSTGRAPLGLVVLGERAGGSKRYYTYGHERSSRRTVSRT